MAFTDWSTTAGSNVSIGGIGILGGNNPSNFDNALREMMAQLRAGVAAKVASTSDNTLPRFDGTTGQFQTSGIVVSDTNDMTSVNSLGVVGTVSAGSFSATGGVTAGSFTTAGIVTAASVVVNGGAGFTASSLEVGASSGITVGFEHSGAAGSCLATNRASSDGAALIFYRSGTQVGSISITTSATSYNTSSDYRIKDEVQAYSGGLKEVLRLKPSTFVMKSDPDKIRQLGFIAHEVQEVFPLAVTGEKDAVDEDGCIIIQQLDHSKLIPALVSAIHEMVAIIEDLQAQVSALTQK